MPVYVALMCEVQKLSAGGSTCAQVRYGHMENHCVYIDIAAAVAASYFTHVHGPIYSHRPVDPGRCRRSRPRSLCPKV